MSEMQHIPPQPKEMTMDNQYKQVRRYTIEENSTVWHHVGELQELFDKLEYASRYHGGGSTRLSRWTFARELWEEMSAHEGDERMTRQDVDVTELVEFVKDDSVSMRYMRLALTKCVCGKTFEKWDFIIDGESDPPSECQNCGRRLYFEVNISVYEVIE